MLRGPKIKDYQSTITWKSLSYLTWERSGRYSNECGRGGRRGHGAFHVYSMLKLRQGRTCPRRTSLMKQINCQICCRVRNNNSWFVNHESSRDLHDPNFEEFVKITTQQFVHLHQEQNFTICGELICKIIDLQKQNTRIPNSPSFFAHCQNMISGRAISSF